MTRVLRDARLGLRLLRKNPEFAGVVVLCHRLWQQRFGGDTGIVGRTVCIEGRPYIRRLRVEEGADETRPRPDAATPHRSYP